MAPLGVLALILATQAAPAATAASLEGVIRDADSGEPLAGAVVALPDLDRATLTDDAGHYAIAAVPPGPQHLVVRRLGYRTRTLHVLVPGAGRLEFDVSLHPGPIPLDPLTVAPAPPIRGLDAGDSTAFPDRGITHAGIRNHPTLAQADPLLALAGGEVVVDPEAPTGLHVRGGGTDHTGYLLDGVPVLNPYHGAGLFSAWNPDALAGLHLEGAAPSPGLPDALSGAVSARTRETGDRLRVQSTLSNTEGRVTVDGPGPGTTSYLLSWRAGLAGQLAPKDEASYLSGEAGDLLATVRVDALGGRLGVLWYESENEVGTASVVPDEAGAGADPPRNAFEWAGRSVGAWWTGSPAAGTRVTLGAWTAGADVDGTWHGGGAPAELGSRRRDLGLRASVQWRSDGATSELGVRVRRMRTTYSVRETEVPYAWDVDGIRSIVTAYAEHARPLGARTDAWAGGSASVVAGELYVAPRARVRWQAEERLALTAAFSRTHQFAQSLRNPESVVGHVFPADLYLGASVGGVPVPRSDQVVLAADLRAGAGVRVGAQAFLRWLDDLVLVPPVEPGPFASGGFTTGSGTARGASVELAASAARFGLVAGYGLQRVRVVSGDSAAYTPRHGTTHTVDAGLIVFPTATLSLRLAVAAAAGRTATAVGGPFEWEACNVLDQGCEFAGSPELEGAPGGTRLPAYARVDFGARKHWHARVYGRDLLLGVFATVTNLLGRYNTLAHVVDPETGERESVEMLPRTPLVFGLDARF